MEEELQCPVCLRLFEDPVILPCSHNVCYNCAEILISKNGSPVSTNSGFNLSQINRKPMEADKMSFISDAVLSDSDSGYSGASASGVGNEGNGSPVASSSYSTLLSSFQPQYNGFKSPTSGCPNNAINMPVLPESVKCLTCPICHRTLFLDERGAAGLSKHTLMHNIIDKYKKNKSVKHPTPEAVKLDSTVTAVNQSVAQSGSVTSKHAVPVIGNAGGPDVTEFCQLCEKFPADQAVVKCLQCDISYCAQCREKCHPSRGPLAKHNLVSYKRNSMPPFHSTSDKPHLYRQNKFPPLPNKPSSKNGLKLASCTQHPSEKTSLYCDTCRVSLCVQCQDEGRHKSHVLKPIGALFRQLKSDLSEQMSALSNKARQAKDLVMLLRGTQEEIEKHSENLEAKTIAKCNHLIEAVERKRDELIQKISREKEMKSKSAREQLQQCTLKLKQTTGLLEYCIEVVKDNDVAAFLQISQSLAERVACMEKQWNSRSLTPRVSCDFDLELETSLLALNIDKLDFIQTKVPDKPAIKVEHTGSSKNNTVTLSWTMPPTSQPTDGFKLEMDNGCDGPFREVYCGCETVCTVDGLHLNSVYKARVRAFNRAGHGPFSDLLHLQTSEATNFEMTLVESHPDLQITGENTLTCRNCEHRIALANTGFSKGIHYWEFSINRCNKRPGPAFGVALADVDKTKMLGKDQSGWALYGPDDEQSWLYSDGQHLKRCDFALKTGTRVGLLLDINRRCVSFYIDGQLLPTPMILNTKITENGESKTYFPAVSLNEHSQVTLHTGVRAPLATQFHRGRCASAPSCEIKPMLLSPRLKSFSTNGESRTPRGTPPPPPIRRSSTGSVRSEEDNASTNGSEPPAPRRSFSSIFQRKTQNQLQLSEQKVAT